jgi:ubiquitin C-terminal hydrolase
MSSSYNSSVPPVKKRPQKSICQLKAQYHGNDQHDSQEFLSFLLDGIHEDLNRIMVKPTWSSTPEHEAELERLPPQIASDQEWRAWRERNDSLIVDYFQGQFRNRLECLTCHTVCIPLPFCLTTKIIILSDFDDIQCILYPSSTHTSGQKRQSLSSKLSGSLFQHRDP